MGDTSMSAAVALPHILVEVLPRNALFLSSPTQSLIVSKRTGDVLYTRTHAHPMQAPKCSSVSSTSQQDKSAADCLVALLGDDKELKVYKVSGLATNTVNMDEIYASPLPKRGVKLAWEDSGESVQTIIVGDKHGDVRSFDIPLSHNKEAGQVTKRRKTENEEDKDEDDDDIDSTHPPHVGHVSMLTDFVLTSFTSPFPQAPASFIITSDRDEHIRISRWGKRRAGYIALRYLLGSTSAVGGLCVVEHRQLESLRQKVQSDVAREMCRQPLLLSTDSSRLRIWSLHKDIEASGRPDCLLVVDLYDAVQQYVKVDGRQERGLQRHYGKGNAETKKKGRSEADKADGTFMKEDSGDQKEAERIATVLHRLTAMEVDGDVYVSFLVDGSSGLFSFSLSRIMSSSAQDGGASLVQVLDLGLPVLSRAADVQEDGAPPHLWLTCDVRRNVAEGVTHRGLRLAAWSVEKQRWEEKIDGNPVIDKQDRLQSEGSPEVAGSLLLYDALALYPKQEFELAVSVKDAIGPNGLVRGGLTSFEALGQYKDKGGAGVADRMSNHKAAGKKVRAREGMLKRIEQTLESVAKPQE